MAVELSPEVIAASTSMTDNGLFPTWILLTSAYGNSTSQPLSDTPTPNDDAGIYVSGGSASRIFGSPATNNSVSNYAVFEFLLPQNYVAGEDITVTYNAAAVAASGSPVNGGSQIFPEMYKLNAAGTMTLVAPAPGNIAVTGAATNYPAVFPGAALSPGDRLFLVLAFEAVNSSSGNLEIHVNSLKIS